MTWQPSLFKLPAVLKASIGSPELDLEVNGEPFDPDYGEVVEVRLFVKIGAVQVGSDKVNHYGDFIDDPSRQMFGRVIPFSPIIVRRLSEQEFADHRKMELLVRQREAEEAGVVSIDAPRAG